MTFHILTWTKCASIYDKFTASLKYQFLEILDWWQGFSCIFRPLEFLIPELITNFFSICIEFSTAGGGYWPGPEVIHSQSGTGTVLPTARYFGRKPHKSDAIKISAAGEICGRIFRFIWPRSFARSWQHWWDSDFLLGQWVTFVCWRFFSSYFYLNLYHTRLYKFVFFLGLTVLKSVLRSRSRKEPQLLVGAGAVTRCGSGSDGSGSDNGIKHG
jgi:hypothetical protein